MKPKMYRKTKASKPDPKMTAWNPKNDSGGGKVQGVILGPESSIGTNATKASADQGNSKK